MSLYTHGVDDVVDTKRYMYLVDMSTTGYSLGEESGTGIDSSGPA